MNIEIKEQKNCGHVSDISRHIKNIVNVETAGIEFLDVITVTEDMVSTLDVDTLTHSNVWARLCLMSRICDTKSGKRLSRDDVSRRITAKSTDVKEAVLSLLHEEESSEKKV